MTDPWLSLSTDEVLQEAAKTLSGANRIALNPDTVEQDLAKLVLGLIELLRKLMELQAIRKMEAGTLTPEQEDRLGETLMRSETALRDIAAKFGLTPADLVLDLGPLGRSV